MIVTIASVVLFAGLLAITAWENARTVPKEEPERELAQTVSLPKPKRTYIRGYYRTAS